jgi:peptide/nickel transport system permease protein
VRGRARLPRFLRTPSGIVGTVLLVGLVALAFIGPLVSPHTIGEPVGAPGTPPEAGAPLGTDFLGRDVLSRLLHGGVSVFLLGGASTLLAYAAGMLVGLVAGYSRSVIDPILMRGVDVLLAFPGLLIMLLLVSGAGSSVPVLLLGVVLVQLPAIARLIRTATLEVSTRGYVEAAIARGERMPSVLVRDVVPNIASVILADIGVRFGYSVILIASMNYLGLGLKPPAADWGLMISENRQFVDLNLWAVVAPAIALALLTIAVNLVADAYVRSLGRSSPLPRRRRTGAVGAPTPVSHL